MKKPDGPDEETIGAIKLRKVHRGGKAHPWKVQLDYRDADDIRRNPSRNNWPLARELARKIDRQLHERTEVQVGENPRFSLAWEKYVERVRALEDAGQKMEPGSRYNIESAGKNYLLPVFGHKKVRDITALDIEEWYLKLRTERRLEDSTRNGLLARWSPFFKFARKRKWVAFDPVKVDPIDRAPFRKRVKVPSWEDADRHCGFVCGPRPSLEGFGVISTKFPRFTWAKRRIITALSYYAGLRPGEIAALRWERINLQRASLEIPEEKATIGGHGRGLKPPKTEAGARVMPIAQYLYDELMWYGDYLTGTGRPPESGFVVFQKMSDARHGRATPQDMERHVYFTRIGKLFTDSMKLAGIVNDDGLAKYGAHGGRHFYISASLLMGVVPEVVAKRVGHKNGAFTSKVYAHVLKTDEDGYIDEIPNEAIWRSRFKRAEPPPPLVQIDDATGEVIDITPDRVALVDMRYSKTGAIQLPALFNSDRWQSDSRYRRGAHRRVKLPEWLHEAIALINAGWSPPDVARRIGKDPSTVAGAFRQAGLPNPHRCSIMVREGRFRELWNMEYGDSDIGRVTGVCSSVVLRWRRANGLAEPANPLRNKDNSQRSKEGDATVLRQNQLKLL